jgi:heat shock protein 5
MLIVYPLTDFSDTQRQAVKDAGVYAGLNILRIIDEHTAALSAHGLLLIGDEDHVLVYDLGGSTLDVSLAYLEYGLLKIQATAGDRHLGGADFDQRIIDHLVKLYRSKTGTDVSSNLDALGKLKKEVEKAKRVLSFQELVTIEIEEFGNGQPFSEILTRSEFEELNVDLFLKTLRSVDQVLMDAGVKKNELYEVGFILGFATLHDLMRGLGHPYWWLVLDPESLSTTERVLRQGSRAILGLGLWT